MRFAGAVVRRLGQRRYRTVLPPFDPVRGDLDLVGHFVRNSVRNTFNAGVGSVVLADSDAFIDGERTIVKKSEYAPIDGFFRVRGRRPGDRHRDEKESEGNVSARHRSGPCRNLDGLAHLNHRGLGLTTFKLGVIHLAGAWTRKIFNRCGFVVFIHRTRQDELLGLIFDLYIEYARPFNAPVLVSTTT